MISTDRNLVLARIKLALGDDRSRPRGKERMAACAAAPRPAVNSDHFAQFIAKARANLFTIDQIVSVRLLVPAVRNLLSAMDLPADLSIAPDLAGLSWPRDWHIRYGAGRKSESASLTSAYAGVAETGSVVFVSKPGTPTTLNFLPDIHIVVLRASAIVPYPEDVWAMLNSADGWPRAINFISGASRTADIAGKVVRPAHGPKAVHLIIVANNGTETSV